jgi:hypothetical protein
VSLARFFELVEDEDFEASLISHRLSEDRTHHLHQAKGLESTSSSSPRRGVFPT